MPTVKDHEVQEITIKLTEQSEEYFVYSEDDKMIRVRGASSKNGAEYCDGQITEIIIKVNITSNLLGSNIEELLIPI